MSIHDLTTFKKKFCFIAKIANGLNGKFNVELIIYYILWSYTALLIELFDKTTAVYYVRFSCEQYPIAVPPILTLYFI